MLHLSPELHQLETDFAQAKHLNMCLTQVQEIQDRIRNGLQDEYAIQQLGVVETLLPPTVTAGLEADYDRSSSTTERAVKLAQTIARYIKEFFIKLYKWVTGTGKTIRIRRSQLQNGWDSLNRSYNSLKDRQGRFPTKREYFQNNLISQGLSIGGKLSIDNASQTMQFLETFIPEVAEASRNQIATNRSVMEASDRSISDREFIKMLKPVPRPSVCSNRATAAMVEELKVDGPVDVYLSRPMAGGKVVVNFQLAPGARTRDFTDAANSDLSAVPWVGNRHGTIITKLEGISNESVKGTTGMAVLSDMEIKQALEMTRISILLVRNNESGIDAVARELDQVTRNIERVIERSMLTSDSNRAMREYVTRSLQSQVQIYIGAIGYMLSTIHYSMSWIRQSLEIYNRTK